jgi:hypothetical protein
MKKQNNKTHPHINETIRFFKSIDKKIDEWVNYFIDQIEEVYHH